MPAYFNPNCHLNSGNHAEQMQHNPTLNQNRRTTLVNPGCICAMVSLVLSTTLGTMLHVLLGGGNLVFVRWFSYWLRLWRCYARFNWAISSHCCSNSSAKRTADWVYHSLVFLSWALLTVHMASALHHADVLHIYVCILVRIHPLHSPFRFTFQLYRFPIICLGRF